MSHPRARDCRRFLTILIGLVSITSFSSRSDAVETSTFRRVEGGAVSQITVGGLISLARAADKEILSNPQASISHAVIVGDRTVGKRLFHLVMASPVANAVDTRPVIVTATTGEPNQTVIAVVRPSNGELLIAMTSLGATVGLATPITTATKSDSLSMLLSSNLLAESRKQSMSIGSMWLISDGRVPDSVVMHRSATGNSIYGVGDAADPQKVPEAIVRDHPEGSFAFLSRDDEAEGTVERFRRWTASALLRELTDRTPTHGSFALADPAAAQCWIGYRSADALTLERIGLNAGQDHLVLVDPDQTYWQQAELDDVCHRGHIDPLPRANDPTLPEIYALDSSVFSFEEEPDRVIGGVVRSKVRFASPLVSPHVENNTVHGEWFRPMAPGPFPAVIVLHIAGGDFDLSRFMSQSLARQKIAALFIKMPYYGERRPPGGKIKMLSPDLDRGQSAMRQTVLDLRRACDWLESRQDVDRRRIGIMGVSLGGITGSLAAAIEPRFRSGCFIMGGAGLHYIMFGSSEREAREYRKLWTEAGGTPESFAAVMAPYDAISYRDRLSRRRVLLIQAGSDEVIPPESQLALWEVSGHQRVIWFPCGHYGMAKYFWPALSHAIQFFQTPDWEHEAHPIEVEK